MTALTPAGRRTAVEALATAGISNRAARSMIAAAARGESDIEDPMQAFRQLMGPSPIEFLTMVDQPGVAEAALRAGQIRSAIKDNDWKTAGPLMGKSLQCGDWRLLGCDSWEHYLRAWLRIGGRSTAAGTDQRAVYFIQPASGGRIKIGVADNVAARLATLQIGSPVELVVIGVIAAIGQRGERELHQRFATSRAQGEWFEPTPELLAYIAENAEVPA